jgi:serine/threonine protein kinase
LGASLYALVFGNVPFLANNVPAIYEKIKNDELTFPNRPTISDQLRDLLVNILEKDPAKRLTLPQIKVGVYRGLNTVWLCVFGWDYVSISFSKKFFKMAMHLFETVKAYKLENF